MPRIYVACLASYNNGVLHGRWIDLDGKDEIEVQDEINAMLRESNYPNVEYTCADCDGLGKVDGDAVRGAVGGTYHRITCVNCAGLGKYPSAEEYAIHDYEELPSSFGEHPKLANVIEYAEMVEEHGDAWRAYVENVGANNATEHDFHGTYAGEADTELDWVENFLEECGTLDSIPENLRAYFNAEAYLRDMKLGGDVAFEELDGTVYAFWNQ